jgi:flavodoxin
MKAIVLYYTRYGNTRRLAEAIGQILRLELEADVLPVEGVSGADLQGADLLIVGSPTHMQNIPRDVRGVLDQLSQGALDGMAVAAFDTSIAMWGALMWLTAGRRLLRRLRKLGGEPIADAETFLVRKGQREMEGQVDLLEEGELERAREWAITLRSVMEKRLAE